jgi:cellulose synthase/poly-beta-1,6-N-acetylglucosamine synthase-like glycosyltransferase
VSYEATEIQRSGAPTRPQDDELVTIVIPVRDEASSIEECLASVLAQDHEALQILVVDGGSRDRTVELVRGLQTHDPRIDILSNPMGRIPISLNAGLASARGRWLVRVDAHSTVPANYVRVLVGHLETGRWGGVGGRKDGTADTPKGRAIAAALGSRVGVGNSAYHYATRPRETDHVPFGAYPVELLRGLGGWNEDLVANEDYELDHRIRLQGKRLLLDPAVRIRWRSRESLRALAGQYFRYGRGKADVARAHPRSLQIRHLAPPLLVAALAPWLALVFLAPFAAAAIAGVYLTLVLATAIAAAFRAGRLRLAPAVAAAIVTMHVSWGLGFWRGILSPGRTPSGDRAITERQPT